MFAGLDATQVVMISATAGIIGPTIIYYLFIKRTPLNWIFNGYKHSQFKLKNEATLKTLPFSKIIFFFGVTLSNWVRCAYQN